MSSISRILVPLDLSPLGEAKLPVAMDQARAFGAELILLHVLPPGVLERDSSVSPEEASARAYIDSVLSRLHAEGVRARSVLCVGSPAETILDQAREQHVDLIVLGSNVRPRFPRLMLGSVADEVVQNAPCPVLLVRPRMEAGVASPVRSFADDAARAGPHAQRHLGIRPVEVARIVGSVGRANELGADFRPLKPHKEDNTRFQRIVRAMETGDSLPPVELYKLGFGYYVLDGNHRVAAAKKLGQLEIDADVIEFVPLGDAEAQRVFAERRAFERATGLTRIEASLPGAHKRLEEIVRAEVEEYGTIDFREGARRFYGRVYRPLVRRIRRLSLARHFPGERSADLVVRLADFRANETRNLGRPLDWDEALDRFAATFGSADDQNLPRRPSLLRRG
jgi:nucleotide-binding universal stress UspA family protein